MHLEHDMRSSCVLMRLVVVAAWAAVGGRGLVVPSTAPGRPVPLKATETGSWGLMYARLEAYKEQWGTADATLSDELGRWCQTQRRLRMHDRLDARQIEALDALGFSWASPSAPEDIFLEWRERVLELRAYVSTHGNGQVPKKYKTNPALGGWVAAVRRRGRVALDAARVDELDRAGFEWTSSRVCGSKFMQGFRELREYYDANGHVNPPPESPLGAWCAAQRLASKKGLLSDQRLDYLRSVEFDFGE